MINYSNRSEFFTIARWCIAWGRKSATCRNAVASGFVIFSCAIKYRRLGYETSFNRHTLSITGEPCKKPF